MKKLSIILLLGFLSIDAFAERYGPSDCAPETEVPADSCCIEYVDTALGSAGLTEAFWDCEKLDISRAEKEVCKKERGKCIDYCDGVYDLDNNTCGNYSQQDPCAGDKFVESVTDSTECDDPNATLCDYDLWTDLCDKNPVHVSERVYECKNGYYNTTDFVSCEPCPGNGVFDYDKGNVGIAGCYIPRGSMTGSDTTGTFQYIDDNCYYQQ